MHHPMFIHNPKNLLIGCKQRCGHTSMFTRFNIPVNTYTGGIGSWIERDPGVLKTIVLRHPIERMWSAVGWYNTTFGEAITAYDSTLAEHGREAAVKAATAILDKRYSIVPEEKKAFFNAGPEAGKRLVDQFIDLDIETRDLHRRRMIYVHHCDLYMEYIRDVDFKYIPFDNLEDYMGSNRIGVLLYESNRSLEGFEIGNCIYTKDDLLREVEHYEYLLKNKEKLSQDEWFELTL